VSGVEITPDGWVVLARDWDLFRFLTDHEPPRPNAVGAQLRVDAQHWRPVTFWVVGAGLFAAAALTRRWPFVAGGAAVLVTYLLLLLSAMWRFRDCPVAVGVVDGLLRHSRSGQYWIATAFTAGGSAAPVAVPATLAPTVTAAGGRAEVFFIPPLSWPGTNLALAVRPLAAGAGPAPWRRLRAGPGLMADAPDVPWGEDARRILAGVEAEAGGDDYLGTRHLLLAAARRSPGAAGPDYAALRAAAPDVAAGPPAPAGRWPTPSLRRAVARAAERALAGGRPVAARDVWHALLTDRDAECQLMLDALGLDPDDLLRVLTGEAAHGAGLPGAGRDPRPSSGA
jgi:Clp amino terminal domain, pathogenicity island component